PAWPQCRRLLRPPVLAPVLGYLAVWLPGDRRGQSRRRPVLFRPGDRGRGRDRRPAYDRPVSPRGGAGAAPARAAPPAGVPPPGVLRHRAGRTGDRRATAPAAIRSAR